MGRHQYRRRYRYRHPKWTKADDARLDAKLLDIVELDRAWLRTKPSSLPELIDFCTRYRNCMERCAELGDPVEREWARRALEQSDMRWMLITAMAQEQLDEHERRKVN